MKKIMKYIHQREFLKFFLMFFSGTLLAQVITVAISPILTRLYSPEDFGAYGLYIAIVSLLIVIVTGRYELAINTTKDEEDGVSLFRIIKWLSAFSSGVILILIYFFGTTVNELLNLKYSHHLLYFIPLTLLVMGFQLGSSYYINRIKDFQTLSKSKIIQSIGNGGTAVSAGFFNLGVVGIIVGNIIGILSAFIYQTLKNNPAKIFTRDLEKDKENLIKYKQYPIYNTPAALFDNLAIQAPILILLRFFSEAIVGYYSLTARVISMPLGLISTSISQVFLSQISELYRDNKSYKSVVIKVARYLGLLGLIPLSIIAIFGPNLFSLVFGAEWKIAGEYARILSLGYFFKFVISPLSVIFFINRRVKLLSAIQMTRAISTVVVLVITSLFFDLKCVLWVYSIHEVIFYIIYFYFILKTSK